MLCVRKVDTTNKDSTYAELKSAIYKIYGEQLYIKQEAVYQKQLNEIYEILYENIEKEINGFYVKYANKEGITMAEAKKRVSKLDIHKYAKRVQIYVKSKDFSKRANEQMRIYNLTMKVNRLEMLKADIGKHLVGGFDEIDQQFGDVLTQRTEDELERQAGILGETVADNSKMAKSIVCASFKNATYSDRVWTYQGMLKAELDKLLQEGLIQGKHPRALARHLENRFGVSKSNAERLMRTELARVQTEAQKQSFEKNGFTKYQFLAIGSACGVCKVIDGKHFDVKDMMPGENAPPMHPNCRCSVSAWEDSEEYEAWLDYLDKGGTTEEWNALKGKSAHCYGDYLRDKLGSAFVNNKEEVDQIVARVKKSGGKVIFHDSQDMVCNVSKGNAAEIRVDKDISIAGLRHEFRHFLDDEINGYPGIAYYLKDKDSFFEFEKRGYEEELAIARERGYTEIEKQILNEIEKRRKEIYGE